MEESTILDITMQEKEPTNGNNTKEILSSLLKKMLDHKLSKLEKKCKEDTNSLKGISKISQNLILSLEYYSHKVRKEIYKIRHKNDENNNKKKVQENNNKSILKEEKIESLIESKENILENNINNISYINKIKRGSKSIDAKKAKELILTPEINNKEKKVKKDKNDVFNRLACKSIGNFKKSKMTITEPSSLLHSKSKNKKINVSKKKMNNIQNKKNDTNIKEDTPSRQEKKEKDKNLLKLTSTPKAKQKSIKKFSQVSLDNTNTIDSINLTTRESNSNKTLGNSGKLRKINSKSKLHKKLKKEEKKNIEENIDNINDISVENKIKELKIENMIITDKDIKEEEKKESINEKIVIDEEILKNVNKDELLISTIKSDKINEIENNENNNNENIIKDFSLKDSINTNMENNINIKKQSTEINNSINSFNQNNNENNIKLVNSINKEKEKEKEDNQMSDLDNIILPKRINNYLDNEKEINFSLINNSQNGNDNNEQDLNKTIDLNISGLSEHLTLEEKFESHLDEITRYLDTNDLCKLKLVNKECYTTIMNILISKTEITIDILEEEIEKLKESNININFDEAKINPFSFSSNSLRAVSLLNNSSGFNLINLENKISREIFIIFGIFFIAVGKKKEYLSYITKEQKINYISNYFKKDISLGNLIEKEIKGKIFDENIIASLYKYSYRYINIISPNRFQKINKDFAIFVFVVKNILEHIGVLEQNIKPQKEFLLYKARLKNNKETLEILNNFFDKIG